MNSSLLKLGRSLNFIVFVYPVIPGHICGVVIQRTLRYQVPFAVFHSKSRVLQYCPLHISYFLFLRLVTAGIIDDFLIFINQIAIFHDFSSEVVGEGRPDVFPLRI